jgi:hypothetical protein
MHSVKWLYSYNPNIGNEVEVPPGGLWRLIPSSSSDLSSLLRLLMKISKG